MRAANASPVTQTPMIDLTLSPPHQQGTPAKNDSSSVSKVEHLSTTGGAPVAKSLTDTLRHKSTSPPASKNAVPGRAFAIEHVIAKLKSTNHDKQQLKNEVARLEEGSAADRKQSSELKNEVARLEEVSSADKKRVTELEKEVALLGESSSADQKRVSELEKQLDKFSGRVFQDAGTQTADIETEGQYIVIDDDDTWALLQDDVDQ